MGPQPAADPLLIRAVADRLVRARDEAFEVSNDLLDHLAETGDPVSQRAVDSLVEHASDTLRALTDSLSETTRQLRTAAGRYASAERSVLRTLDEAGDDA